MRTPTLLACLGLFTASPLCPAASVYTWSTTAPDTYNWSSASGWSPSGPAGGIGTGLTFFAPGAALSTGTVISNNDFSGSFLLNNLTLNGTAAANIISGLTLQGGALEFVNDNSTAPTLALNALKGSGTSAVTYTVNNAVTFTGDTSISGNGTAVFIFGGTITGAGDLVKTGTSRLNLNGVNTTFAYTGDISISGGTLGTSDTAARFYSRGALTVSNGGTFDISNGHVSVASLSGTAGTLTSTAGSARYLFNSYSGDTGNGFTGTIGGHLQIALTGSGDTTLGTFVGSGSTSVTNMGTGLVTLAGLTSTGASGATLMNPYAVIKLTGTSGQVNGVGISQLSAGTLWIAPSTVGSTSDITVTGQTSASTGAFRIYGGNTLKLDKGGNQSVNFQLGNSTSAARVITRLSNLGTLVIDPVNGSSTLGTTAKLTVLGTSSAIPLTNGASTTTTTNTLANTAFVVVDNDLGRSADFVTYTGTGLATDIGFQRASYSLTDTFVGSTNGSAVKLTGNAMVSANTSAFALRNDATLTIASGVTLTLGNSGAVSGPQTGLILNGGTIAATDATSTLSFDGTEALIYTSRANGTISAKITGTGTFNTGFANTPANTLVALSKFGEGTLFLTGANTYSGVTMIHAGALDAGLNAGSLSSSSNLRFNGGVLQGNGSFTRALGTLANQVTWSAINNAAQSLMGGGFAAKGGSLTVNIGGASQALTWGATNFLTENTLGAENGQSAMLMFGSNTSDSQVNFVNDINLGVNASPLYYRLISVVRGTGTDSAKLSGVISSTVTHGLLKVGDGKLILTGNNTYAGDTVTSAGSLFIDGVTNGQGSFTVNAGATLGGAGTIGLAASKTVTVEGLSGNLAHLTSGTNGSGTFSIGSTGNNNQVVLGPHSVFDTSISGATASLLVVTGDLSINGTDSSISLTSFSAQSGISYIIATYSGTLTGTFSDISSLVNQGFTLDYGSGFDSFISINLTTVPEPSSLAVIMAVATLGFVFFKRRQRPARA